MSDTKTEKQFEDGKVKPFLKSLDTCWFYKVHGGSIYQVAGIPDIIGLINGHFIALELKRDGGKPSKLQERNINVINKCGGYARFVYPHNWEEIRNDLIEMSRIELISEPYNG